jgi:hypothetical protein
MLGTDKDVIRLVLADDSNRDVAGEMLGSVGGYAADIKGRVTRHANYVGRLYRVKSFTPHESTRVLTTWIHMTRLLAVAPEALSGLKDDNLALAVAAIVEADEVLGKPEAREREARLVERFVKAFPVLLYISIIPRFQRWPLQLCTFMSYRRVQQEDLKAVLNLGVTMDKIVGSRHVVSIGLDILRKTETMMFLDAIRYRTT